MCSSDLFWLLSAVLIASISAAWMTYYKARAEANQLFEMVIKQLIRLRSRFVIGYPRRRYAGDQDGAQQPEQQATAYGIHDVAIT